MRCVVVGEGMPSFRTLGKFCHMCPPKYWIVGEGVSDPNYFVHSSHLKGNVSSITTQDLVAIQSLDTNLTNMEFGKICDFFLWHQTRRTPASVQSILVDIFGKNWGHWSKECIIKLHKMFVVGYWKFQTCDIDITIRCHKRMRRLNEMCLQISKSLIYIFLKHYLSDSDCFVT